MTKGLGDYTIREIPTDLHNAWKSVAGLMGLTMKEYVFRALRNQLNIDLKASGKGKDKKS